VLPFGLLDRFTPSGQVASFMSGMRHEIGRGMMRDSLVATMEDIRATWQR
jgi:hypothetical protein